MAPGLVLHWYFCGGDMGLRVPEDPTRASPRPLSISRKIKNSGSTLGGDRFSVGPPEGRVVLTARRTRAADGLRERLRTGGSEMRGRWKAYRSAVEGSLADTGCRRPTQCMESPALSISGSTPKCCFSELRHGWRRGLGRGR